MRNFQVPPVLSLLAVLLLSVSLLASSADAQQVPEAASWIRVSDDSTHFVRDDSGTRFHPMGFNYDHDADGRLIEDYWHTEWDRVENDFRDMQALGATVVRVHLQFGRFMKSVTEASEPELEQLRRLLKLAEETQLTLDLTGLGCYHKKDVPGWYDAMSTVDRWKAQQAFWEAIASTCKDSSSVFCYDLMNEPVIGGETPSTDWLGPAFGGKHFVQFVARSTEGRSRPEVARDWIEQMVNAVRKHDSRHMITVGLVDWSLDRPGLTSGFVPKQVTEKLNFLAVHIYPKAGTVDEALETLKGFQIGKPVIVEETFPLACSLDELESFMDRSGADCQGWLSFFWGKMPAEYAADNSIAAAVISQWLSRFSARIISTAARAAVVPEAEAFPVVQSYAEYSAKHADGITAFTIDQSAWADDVRRLPIGVFDSGIGGLTVQEAIFSLDAFHNDTYAPGPDGRKDFETERFIYFGDQANMPYGNYPSVQRQDFLKELILKDAAFLLGTRYWPASNSEKPRFDKPPVKALVIACNTATAWGLEELRQLVEAWKIPVFVVGVVEAGARGVAEVLDSDDRPRTVAVLATVGTCGSNAYPKAIGRTAGLAGKRIPVVVQQGCVGLAGAIENDPAFMTALGKDTSGAVAYQGPSVGHRFAALETELMDVYGFEPSGLLGDEKLPETLRLNSVENYIRYDVATLVKNHKASGQVRAIDTVVLGCTHFPLVRQEILQAFARLRLYEKDGMRPFESLISESITIVDPAELTAKELFREMARRKAFRAADDASFADRDLFFMSVANAKCTEARFNPDGSLERDYKYSRQPGHLELEDTICVPMELTLLPSSSVNLIRSKLPEVWKRLAP